MKLCSISGNGRPRSTRYLFEIKARCTCVRPQSAATQATRPSRRRKSHSPSLAPIRIRRCVRSIRMAQIYAARRNSRNLQLHITLSQLSPKQRTLHHSRRQPCQPQHLRIYGRTQVHLRHQSQRFHQMDQSLRHGVRARARVRNHPHLRQHQLSAIHPQHLHPQH